MYLHTIASKAVMSVLDMRTRKSATTVALACNQRQGQILSLGTRSLACRFEGNQCIRLCTRLDKKAVKSGLCGAFLY